MLAHISTNAVFSVQQKNVSITPVNFGFGLFISCSNKKWMHLWVLNVEKSRIKIGEIRYWKDLAGCSLDNFKANNLSDVEKNSHLMLSIYAAKFS